MELQGMYGTLGVSSAVYSFGQAVLEGLRARFEQVDAVAEYNQAKVLGAMQRHRVSAACFAATTGYGYDDVGRQTLEKVYADVFHTEAALVRPQITCGTHALAVALSANLLPGDELLSPVGTPYDTLEEVIGIPDDTRMQRVFSTDLSGFDNSAVPAGIVSDGILRMELPARCAVILVPEGTLVESTQ